jgi:XTP/dITP diphosphohydrolase
MKKIFKLLIGTNNKGKYKEIKDLLPKYIKAHSISEFNLKSPVENGLTFTENSLIKSKHFSKKTKLICLADDSGLEIDILDKSPGIYSARWGGKKGDFKKAINKVYKELSKKDKNWKFKKVKARFICALSICYLDKKIASVLGKVEGYISEKPKGKNGFGYDPIFIPKNKRKTFGEMNSLQKYKIDHRFNAFKKIKKFL